MYQSSITLSSILTGISKVLGIANQAIPLYKEIKPMAGNLKNVYNLIKDININNNSKTIVNTSAKERISPNISNKPTFFLNN